MKQKKNKYHRKSSKFMQASKINTKRRNIIQGLQQYQSQNDQYF